MGYTGEHKRQYDRRWLQERRKRINVLLGGQCVSCGSTERLEIDHIDPATKDPSLRNPLRGFPLSWSWTRILAEIAKCQLLCHQCHCRKTLAENLPDGVRHGTAGSWRNARCRCDICRAWQAKTTREYRRARKQRDVA